MVFFFHPETGRNSALLLAEKEINYMQVSMGIVTCVKSKDIRWVAR